MKIKSLLICVAAVCAAGCGNNRKAEQFVALPFPDAVPPAMMEDQQDRAEYMALHWWDGITDPSREYPCDTAMVSGVRRSDVEQKMANWTNVLNMVSQESRQTLFIMLPLFTILVKLLFLMQ